MARARWKMLVPTATLTLTPFTLSMPSASAFFPPVSPPATVNPVSPPPFVVVPPVVPPPVVVVPPTQPPSNTVPEPSTLMGGLAGLTAAAGYAARRRKKAAAQS